MFDTRCMFVSHERRFILAVVLVNHGGAQHWVLISVVSLAMIFGLHGSFGHVFNNDVFPSNPHRRSFPNAFFHDFRRLFKGAREGREQSPNHALLRVQVQPLLVCWALIDGVLSLCHMRVNCFNI